MKLWANDSEKTQACNIRREAKKAGLPIPSNDEIILRLRAKQINSTVEKPIPTATNIPSALPPGCAPRVSFTDVDEAAYKQYLLLCMNGGGDIRVCTELRNYLDKTQALQPKARTTLPLLSEEDYPEFSDSDTAVCP